MGNKITKRRDTVKNAETPAAEEPAATVSAGESEVPEPQETTETENLEVVVGKPLEVCLPSEECTSEMKQAKDPAATQSDAEPKETPAPVQSQLQVPSCEPAPTSEPFEEPKSVVEAQLVPEPEPISESAPAPAEALEQQTDVLTLESTPEPGISSPPLVDLGVPDVILQPVISPQSPETHGPVDAEKPTDILLTEESEDIAQAAEIPTSEPETSAEEAAEHLEQLVGDVNEDSVSGLLKNLELQGNDLVADLIPSDVKIHDETPNTDICSSTELM